jgi:Domain of unknown function (DUF4395)
MSRANGTVHNAATHVSRWMARNLVTQGYCLTDRERRQLNFGLRFATGLCLPIVALSLLLHSPVLLATLAAIAAVAGLTPRHPFDLLWNYGLRHRIGAPPLPPTPIRRRHAFKFGAVCLLIVAGLFAAGRTTDALALGGALLAACGLVTVTNFCVPSFLLSIVDRSRAPSTPRPRA